MLLRGGTIRGPNPELPRGISDGTVRVDDREYRNVVPAPLSHSGPALIHFDLDDGSGITIAASGVELTLRGNPTFLEAFGDV